MCDGCKGLVSVTRSPDGLTKPLHQSSDTKRLFIFETYPVFGIKYLKLERTV